MTHGNEQMAPETIVCFGDSLTNGARDEYHRSYPMELSRIIRQRTGRVFACLNYGINGQTTSQMLNRAHGVLGPNRAARLVLFLGGTNDTKVPMPDDIYRDNVESIVLLSRSFGLRIALGLLPPIYGPGLPCYSQSAGNEKIAGYNRTLEQLADTYDCPRCDFRAYGPERYCDGVHMNHAGYLAMAEDWYESIKGLL